MNKIIKWNPDKENICPKNKRTGHLFTIKKYGYTYCQYCGVNQCFNCSSDKKFIELKSQVEKGEKLCQ